MAVSLFHFTDDVLHGPGSGVGCSVSLIQTSKCHVNPLTLTTPCIFASSNNVLRAVSDLLVIVMHILGSGILHFPLMTI